MIDTDPITPRGARAIADGAVHTIITAEDLRSPAVLIHTLTAAARLGREGFDAYAHSVVAAWARAAEDGEVL